MSEPQKQVDREMAFIPRGSDAQNEFRMVFNARRLNSLGVNAEGPTDLRSVFEASAASVRANYPAFVPEYDPQLFAA